MHSQEVWHVLLSRTCMDSIVANLAIDVDHWDSSIDYANQVLLPYVAVGRMKIDTKHNHRLVRYPWMMAHSNDGFDFPTWEMDNCFRNTVSLPGVVVVENYYY